MKQWKFDANTCVKIMTQYVANINFKHSLSYLFELVATHATNIILLYVWLPASVIDSFSKYNATSTKTWKWYGMAYMYFRSSLGRRFCGFEDVKIIDLTSCSERQSLQSIFSLLKWNVYVFFKFFIFLRQKYFWPCNCRKSSKYANLKTKNIEWGIPWMFLYLKYAGVFLRFVVGYFIWTLLRLHE